MSVSSGPPEIPPDSPGSSVSSGLQNEYTDLLKRAVILTNHGETTKLTLNPLILGRGRERMSKKNDKNAEMIENETPRNDRSQSEIEIRREHLSQIPTLNEILSTRPFSTEDEENLNGRSLSRNSSNSMINSFLRYSNLMNNEFEAKPITEKMDHWYLDMKKNLITEFDKLRIEFLEEAQRETLREKQAQAKEYARLNQDIKTMREMLTRYEEKLAEKERNEKNLNKALDHLYNKTIIYRRYFEWRLVHIEQRRQQYSFILAKRFYDDKIKRKVLNQWKSFAESGWKKRFENACDKKAKDVLKEVATEYESKLKKLEIELAAANEEIARFKSEREEKDEEIRKAFMRGVCALNMEAMSVLLNNPNEIESPPSNGKIQNETNSTDEPNFRSRFSRQNFEEQNRTDFPNENHQIPSAVFKEHLPSTIYRTGEARPVSNFHQKRQVVFTKRTGTSNFNGGRGPATTVFVERHGPTNRIQSSN